MSLTREFACYSHNAMGKLGDLDLTYIIGLDIERASLHRLAINTDADGICSCQEDNDLVH